MAEAKLITGYVYDVVSMSEPIMGATILLEGTSTGTTTDANGYYTLRLQPVPAPTARLVCSSLGFKTQYVVIGNETSITFYLEEDGDGVDSDPDSAPKIFGNISNILLNGESATEVWLNGIQIWPEELPVLYFPFKVNINYYNQSTGSMRKYTALDTTDLGDLETYNAIVLRATNGSEMHYDFEEAEQYFPGDGITFILEMYNPPSYFNNSAGIDLVIFPSNANNGFEGINVNEGSNVIYPQRLLADVYDLADNDAVPYVDVYLNQCVAIVEDGDLTISSGISPLMGTRTSWTITCSQYKKGGVTYGFGSAITLSSGGYEHQWEDTTFPWGAGNASGFHYKVLPKEAWNSTLICNYTISNSRHGFLAQGTFNASIIYDYTIGQGGFQEVYITPPSISVT